MELYQREFAREVVLVSSWLSVLTDQVLVAFWGIYSRENQNCFWAKATSTEISAFLKWAEGKPMVTREIAKAQREAAFRKEDRAASRQVRPRPRFITSWDDQKLADPRIQSRDLRPSPKRKTGLETLMTIHQLIDSTNQWSSKHAIAPGGFGDKLIVDERTIRKWKQRDLLDSPGSPEDGRKRGFTQKHACQARLILIFLSRSMRPKDINAILYGKELPQLLELEGEELAVFAGLPRPKTPVKARMLFGCPFLD